MTKEEKDTFLYRKITSYGRARYLAVTKFIPKQWRIVAIEVEDNTPESVTVKIRKID